MRLRAMVSSTIAGMEADRARAAGTLEAIGFETLLSERAGSAAAAPEAWCEAAARECDLFILLLGPQYGWVIPHHGISVVGYEFETALAADRSKILVFLRDASSEETDPRQAAFIEKVCDFRSGHFRATPYRGPDDLAERIKADVTEWLQSRLRDARFAPEGIALLTARRPLRAAVLDLWLVALGAAVTVLAITVADPFYRRVITWAEQLNGERVRWVLTEGATTLLQSCVSLLLGASVALGILMLLIRVWRRRVPLAARFLSGLAAGTLVPVALVGPVWFGFSKWQVILLGATLVCAMTLSRFARFVTELDSYRASELLVSWLVTRAWVPAFLAVAAFATVYCGVYLGGGLLDVWITANRYFLEGIKFVAVLLFLGGLWSAVAIAGLLFRQLARVLLLRRLAQKA